MCANTTLIGSFITNSLMWVLFTLRRVFQQNGIHNNTITLEWNKMGADGIQTNGLKFNIPRGSYTSFYFFS